MRVARIITSQEHGKDEDELKQQLQAAGYEVEVAEPGQANARAADLEIELDSVPAAEALEAALRLARDGADVFIAPGVLRQEPAPQAAPAVVAEQSTIAPGPASQPFTAAEPQPQAEADDTPEEPRAPSVLQRVGNAWAERQRRAEERRLERELRAREEEQRQRQQALELQRRREQEERARVERLRILREEMAHEAALRAQRARQIEENERRRAAEVPRQVLRPVQTPDAQRLAAMQAQMQRAPKPGGAPSRRPVAPASGARPVAPPRRRMASPRERQWQRAALLASLVALMAMLGFAAAMNLHPAAPLPSQMLNNSAQQQVPFGAATITPAKPANPAPVRAAAPVATARPAAAVSPARKPVPRPSAAREKPAPRARRSGNRVASDDEVVVRHFSSSTTARSQQSDGIRRYSDQ